MRLQEKSLRTRTFPFSARGGLKAFFTVAGFVPGAADAGGATCASLDLYVS